MVYTTKGFTDNSPIPSSQYMTVKKTSTRKTRSQFLDTLEIKPKTAVGRFCAAKPNQKAIRYGRMLWYSIPKIRGHSKINQQVKKYLCNWIIKSPQVVYLLIENDCPKMSIDGQV